MIFISFIFKILEGENHELNFQCNLTYATQSGPEYHSVWNGFCCWVKVVFESESTSSSRSLHGSFVLNISSACLHVCMCVCTCACVHVCVFRRKRHTERTEQTSFLNRNLFAKWSGKTLQTCNRLQSQSRDKPEQQNKHAFCVCFVQGRSSTVNHKHTQEHHKRTFMVFVLNISRAEVFLF